MLLFEFRSTIILCFAGIVSGFTDSEPSGPARCSEGFFDSSCQDVSRSCAMYKAGGFCSLGHMKKMCKSTCGECDVDEAPACQKCSECKGWSSIPVVPCGYKNGDVGCAVCDSNQHLYAEFNSGSLNDEFYPHTPPQKKGESACRSLQCSCHSTMRCRLQYLCFHSCMHGNTRTLARHICVGLESSQMYLQLKWSSPPFHPLSLHLKRGSWACDLLRMPLVHKCKLERVYCMGYGKELLWPVVRMECLFVCWVKFCYIYYLREGP